MHDSLAAIPLSLMTAERVTNCYDLMDAAYCSGILREYSRNLGHVPLIDHNPRRGEKPVLRFYGFRQAFFEILSGSKVEW
jgi:hypothetical protein